MLTPTTDWAIAYDHGFGAGFGTGGSIGLNQIDFRLQHIPGAEAHGLRFVGLNIEVGFIPISGGISLIKTWKRIKTSRKVTFDDIHLSSARFSVFAKDPMGVNATSTLEVAVGKSMAGSILFEFEVPARGILSTPSQTGVATGQVEIIKGSGDPEAPFPGELIIDDPIVQPPRFPGYTYIPSVVPPHKRKAHLIINEDVLFGFDSDRVKPDARKELAGIAAELRRKTSTRIVVEGHTDSTGSKQYNQGLSERRANAVKDWLIENGVAGSVHFTAVGYGETKPVASNASRVGRAQNRRVELREE